MLYCEDLMVSSKIKHYAFFISAKHILFSYKIQPPYPLAYKSTYVWNRGLNGLLSKAELITDDVHF
jgi:hypothetical protein